MGVRTVKHANEVDCNGREVRLCQLAIRIRDIFQPSLMAMDPGIRRNDINPTILVKSELK
jgi:hypothetical protein